MDKTTLTAKMTVETVLQQWPETVSVFQAFNTACPGCAMAPFDTLEDVARIYGLDLEEIMGALQHRIEEKKER